MLNDGVTARLSGEIAVEPTNGAASGLLVFRTRDWSDRLIERARIDRSLFPRVIEPGTVIAAVTAAAASVGLGLFADLAEAAGALVRWECEVEPNLANRAIYDEAKARWQAAYAVQKTLVDRKITTLLWSAPGAIAD